MMQKWELSDYQWEQIKHFFPPKTSNMVEQDVIQESYSMQLSGY